MGYDFMGSIVQQCPSITRSVPLGHELGRVVRVVEEDQWDMLDVRLPLSRKLEKLHSIPVHSIYVD